MAKIEFFTSENVDFVEAEGGAGASRQHHPGGPDALHLFEVKIPPGRQVGLHAHQLDEIIHIIDGELSFGNRLLRRGDSVFIEGMTLYGFQAGPEGVTFLNFRKRRDHTYYTSSEFNEYRKLDVEGRAAMDKRLIAARMRIKRWEEADDLIEAALAPDTVSAG